MKAYLTWGALAAALSIGVHAQTVIDEPPAGDPTEFVDGDALEVEPLDRLEANRKAYLPVTEEGWQAAIQALTDQRTKYASQMAGAIAPKGFPTWKPIGPVRSQYLFNGVTVTGFSDAGRVAKILPHPTDPKTVYVLFSGGGLWKTSNFNADTPTWKPLTDSLVSTSGGAVTFGRTATTLYLGVGDFIDVLGTVAGTVVKSTDGGATWGTMIKLPGATAVRDIQVDRNGVSDVVLVGTNVGLFRSTDGGVTYVKVAGGLGEAFNGKSIWSLVQTSIGWVAAAQADAQSVGAGPGTVHVSTDRGATWVSATTPPIGRGFGVGRITLAVATPGERKLYATAGTSAGSAQDDLYVSNDGGSSWAPLGVTTKAPLNPNCRQRDMDVMHGQAYYNQALLVDPTDVTRNTLYTGGNLSGAKSTDGGQSWRLISNWLPDSCGDGADKLPYVHADFHAAAMVVNGSTPALVFGTDGGLFASFDGGKTFADRNQGLQTFLSQTVISSPAAYGDIVISGLQDDGTRQRIGNSSNWNQVIGGDGEGVGWSQANSLVAIGSVYNSSIRRYDNPVNNPAPGGWVRASSGISGGDIYPFYTPIGTPTAQADPTGQVFFTSTGLKVYRTVNGAKSWAPIFNSYPNQSFNLNHYVIGVHPRDVNRVAMAGTGGRAFYTLNGGASWNITPIRSQVPAYPGINISPSWGPNNTMYMASASTTPNVLRMVRSTDNGSTWTAAGNGLPNVAISQVLADPRDDSGLSAWAATWIGVYVTRNGGSSWSLLGAGLPNVWVRGMALTDQGVLRVATYGRGLWEIKP